MTIATLLTMVQILQVRIPPPFGDHLEPFGGHCLYKTFLHKIAIHYHYSRIWLQHGFISGDHACILLHSPFIPISSSGGIRINRCYFGLGGFYVISHAVININERQYACFQSFLCPLMSAIPELVQPGSVFTTLRHKGGIKSKDAFLLLQGMVQGIKQSHKGQWCSKLLPDRSVRVPSIAA